MSVHAIQPPVAFSGRGPRFAGMSRAAAILMFLAWLLYGAMPAVGMPMVQPVDETPQVSMADHAQHDMDISMDMAETLHDDGHDNAHAHGPAQKPCPHGGKICVTPFCAACLTLLPEIFFGSQRLSQLHPSPDLAQSLLSIAPAPLTPPPRA